MSPAAPNIDDPSHEPGSAAATGPGQADLVADLVAETSTTSAELVAAEHIHECVEVVDERTWPFRLTAASAAAVEWLFGLASLLAALAVVATVPVVQLLSLGYLLEASGRVARSGRLRDGIFGVRQAARVGSLVLGTWLMILLLQVVSEFWYSSHLIDPAGEVTRRWRFALVALTALMVLHLVSAWYCGARLRHFFWPVLAVVLLPWWLFRRLVGRILIPRADGGSGRRPFAVRLLRDLLLPPPLQDWFVPAIVFRGLRRGGLYQHSRDAVWDFVLELRVRYFFWLGLRGALGAAIWLLAPILIFIAATQLPPGPGVLAGLFGGLLFFLVLLYLPFLQALFAAENRWGALFQVGEVRRLFQRTPLAFGLALLVTLLFALPLYLLKIELTPREIAFLPSIFFVAFILPARLLTGWAVGRARRREGRSFFLWRWLVRLAEVPAVAFFVFVVFFTRYTSWYGVWSLFEQHAFLIPVPFLGM
jgi:hypothetical protein